MWKGGNVEPVRVMGAEGYPYGSGKAAAPHRVGRSFIIRPFPLAETTNPARNDQTRVVPPKCAAYFLG